MSSADAPAVTPLTAAGGATVAAAGVGAPGGVQSVERAFALLQAVAGAPAGISELARRVGLATSTVARLLATLESLGAVAKLGDGSYGVGAGIGELAAAIDGRASLVERVRPLLRSLVGVLGETAGVSVLAGREVHYLDHVEAEQQVQVRGWNGTRLPLHVVSSGLVLLAHRSPSDVDRYLSGPLERFTAKTVTDPAAIRARLEAERADGFVWTAREFDESITSVAAALHDRDGAVIGSLHVHGPAYRFPAPGTDAAVARTVCAAAASFSA